MSITPLTGDPSAIEVTFPTMPGQEEFRQLGYDLIDLVAQHLYQVRLRPPHRPVSEEARRALELLPLPESGVTAEEIVTFFEERIQPYPTFGIGHPRGFGLVAGGSDPMAVLGSLLSAALNANCIGEINRRPTWNSPCFAGSRNWSASPRREARDCSSAEARRQR